ncbi:MAG: dienelactone hydrolase family protein [Lentisphaeria bacterium]|nr:dienelactone hydrolase family protein [Lentisphaeria bacterium]
MPKELQEKYSYKSSARVISVTSIKSSRVYDARLITLDKVKNIFEPAKPHRIDIEHYQPSGIKKAPVVIVMPILGGSYHIARHFAKYFAKHGFAAVFVHRQKKYRRIERFEKLDLSLEQMIIDHKQVIDWVMQQDEFEHDKIAAFGFSMGGIKCALLSAMDTRIKASIIGMAGANIPEILYKSKAPAIKKQRIKFLKRYELSKADYLDRLKESIHCDPLNYAKYISAENTLMILAKYDRYVPYKNGVLLRSLIGEPETIYLYSGHLSAALSIPYIQRQSVDFLKRKLMLSQD